MQNAELTTSKGPYTNTYSVRTTYWPYVCKILGWCADCLIQYGRFTFMIDLAQNISLTKF